MASNQQFNLRWNNHTNNILQVFMEHLSSENLVDVTLSCQGQFLKAHKMVLSACSPYFQELFRQHQVAHPIIIMNGMKFADIKQVVEFMYRGEIKVLETELDGLLAAAETLQVKGLSNVRNKYEKGDIQCGDAAPVLDSPDSDITPLHLRRKRRKRSDSGSSERVGVLEPLEGSVVPTAESTPAKPTLPFVQVTMNDYMDDDELPATIKVEPPDIRDIDEEEPTGWESPKLVIDMPDSEQPKQGPLSNKPPPDGSTARYMVELQQGAGPSRDEDLLLPQLLAHKRGPKKRLGKIPRPPNAFMIFANEWRRKLAFQHPSESNKEISVRLGIMWKNLSSDAKEGYYTASRQADEEHKRMYPGYYYSPKEARIRKNMKHEYAMARRGAARGCGLDGVQLVKDAETKIMQVFGCMSGGSENAAVWPETETQNRKPTTNVEKDDVAVVQENPPTATEQPKTNEGGGGGGDLSDKMKVEIQEDIHRLKSEAEEVSQENQVKGSTEDSQTN